MSRGHGHESPFQALRVGQHGPLLPCQIRSSGVRGVHGVGKYPTNPLVSVLHPALRVARVGKFLGRGEACEPHPDTGGQV